MSLPRVSNSEPDGDLDAGDPRTPPQNLLDISYPALEASKLNVHGLGGAPPQPTPHPLRQEK